VVPADGDDVDDALDDAMGDAFDAVFVAPAKKSAKPAVPFVPGDASLDLAQICAALALEKKADDVVILQVAELTSYADQFVIAAAASERQAQAVARNIVDELRRRGKQPLSTDGLEQGNWVIVDYGSVVVHIFMQSARAYYDLDGFWIDAPRIAVDEGRGKAALEHLG
jgi:ribosome-associated protein